MIIIFHYFPPPPPFHIRILCVFYDIYFCLTITIIIMILDAHRVYTETGTCASIIITASNGATRDRAKFRGRRAWATPPAGWPAQHLRADGIRYILVYIYIYHTYISRRGRPDLDESTAEQVRTYRWLFYTSGPYIDGLIISRILSCTTDREYSPGKKTLGDTAPFFRRVSQTVVFKLTESLEIIVFNNAMRILIVTRCRNEDRSGKKSP